MTMTNEQRYRIRAHFEGLAFIADFADQLESINHHPIVDIFNNDGSSDAEVITALMVLDVETAATITRQLESIVRSRR
jgi:hypothetical protein